MDIPRVTKLFQERFPYLDRGVLDEFFSGPFALCRRSQRDTKKEIAPYLEKMGWLGTIDEYFENWHWSEAVFEFRLIHWIRQARKKRIVYCVTTNNDPYRMKFMREQMRFDEIFDQGFYEYELGIGKPHKQFYQIMLDTLARDHDITDPSEIHIWDDRQKYLDPAEKM